MNGKPVIKKTELRFINSFRSILLSLDLPARNLTNVQCKKMQWFCQEQEVFMLMQHKGVYPYEYMDKWERFEETKLPTKEGRVSLTKTMNMLERC